MTPSPTTSKFGLSPGTLVYVGPEVAKDTTLKLVEYNEKYHEERVVRNLRECRISGEKPYISWLDVDGIHESEVIEAVGQLHHVHPLLLEDIMNTRQKPKIEFYNDTYVFVSLKMLYWRDQEGQLDAEHVSFLLGSNYLISFQEKRTNDIFGPVLDRIKASVGKTRRNGADYLLFSLIDLMVDTYLEILERMSEELEELEGQILAGKHKDPITQLYNLKRQLTLMRKYVWPLRDMLSQGLRENSKLIGKSTFPYFRDVHDHVTNVIESIDSNRELLTGLIDIHYSTLSSRMNSVMKTLTIYSAVFMPLTFIAGIYGMNFNNMPELRQPNGYFYTLGGMGVLAIGLLIYFRRRGWM
ncbi:magnesium/cobalt transporter CorA [Runella slithyformis]|uniref:Magnesium transport protein CorA n=1 Tax=Runella slithyformis (strain ATCC 29530 / DSM 19594 / LMG 11500 / NCIMB 11436 / LSU 4) TaxID=761193 RepID=A0A7U4E6W8_RUNSL|nr:magnesium/cobalt transporter CorA [Runella slithyformis]AEI50043.1 magnesium and cobalt transport protein CorA [Runella slithyformis DSM 19594]